MINKIFIVLSLATAMSAMAASMGSETAKGPTRAEACSNAKNQAQRSGEAQTFRAEITLEACDCSQDKNAPMEMFRWVCEVSWKKKEK